MPREKASMAEEKGRYLLNTPIVPNISIEEINIPIDLRLFVLNVKFSSPGKRYLKNRCETCISYKSEFGKSFFILTYRNIIINRQSKRNLIELI